MWLEMVNESSEEPNPKLHQLPYGISVGTSLTSDSTEFKAPFSVMSDDPIPSTSSGNQEISTSNRRKTNKRSHDALDRSFSHETDETEVLSTSALQRLVLLEQLDYIRQKRSMIRAKPTLDLQIESVNSVSAQEFATKSRFVMDPEIGKEYEEL